MKSEPVYPKHKAIKNCRIGKLYLSLLRHNSIFGRLMGRIIGCEINCPLPDRLFLAHPNGIIVGRYVVLENDVVLNHQITVGGKNPYFQGDSTEKEYPHLKEGVYVGPGARILGHCTIGEWAIIGANAVVTKDVPPYATVVGNNKIIQIRRPGRSEKQS
ncbi:MAG: serine O-acetyltransferase [Kiritimatiellales bacterium]